MRASLLIGIQDLTPWLTGSGKKEIMVGALKKILYEVMEYSQVGGE